MKNLNLTGLIIIGQVMLSGCAGLLPDRSYIEEMNRESDPYFMPGKDFPVVSGDSGEAYRSKDEIGKRTPASERSKKISTETESLKQELADKEAEIAEVDLEQYTKDKKYLLTDSEKLYYLSLNKTERSSYVNIKKQDLQDDISGKSKEFMKTRSIRSAELYIGMDKKQVEQAWGRPAKVDIAGNPRNQNERWSFFEDGNIKQVFFESGKVQGWALDL